VHQKSAASKLAVVVQQGQLSVDVQEADLEEVLAHIGRQAGIRISPGPSSGKRVSARFSGVALEDGLRRLLRSAHLSHLFLYAKGPTGAVTISEVRVLGEGQEVTSPSAILAAPGVPTHEPNAEAPSGKGRRQPSAAVEPVQEITPEPGQEEPSELTHRIREVFTLSKEMGARPLDSQELSPPESKPPSSR
jgi:hypothetical protein